MAQQSIGEEVIEWAEKYWHMDKAIKGELSEDGEQFHYDYFRKVLIDAINEKIQARLFLDYEPTSYGTKDIKKSKSKAS